MAIQIHQLPLTDTVPSDAYMILKRDVLGSQLDYRVDINFLFSPYVDRNTEVGTGVGHLVKLIDVNGSPGFPAVDGSQLTNLFPERASDTVFGVTQLSDDINSALGATLGETAATPRAVRDMGLTKFNITGGDMSGDIVFDNSTGIQIRRGDNVPIDLLQMDINNDVVAGHTTVGDYNVRASDYFVVQDSSLVSRFLVNLANGNITTTSSIDVPAGSEYRVGGFPVGHNGGTTYVGEVGSVPTNLDLYATSNVRVRDSAGTVIFQMNPSNGSLSGFDASWIEFTPTGNIGSANVQNAIQELDSEKLSVTGTAANAQLLDNLNSTSFVRSDVNDTVNGNMTFQGSATFNNPIGTYSSHLIGTSGYTQWGVSTGGEGVRISYNSSTNTLYQNWRSGATDWVIEDDGVDRFLFNMPSGNFTALGNITAYSDIRIKDDFKKIEDALDKVMKLSGFTYERTDVDCPRQTGLVAQDVQRVLPEAVTEGKDGILSVAYGNMLGLMVEAIKELSEKVDKLGG